jgi:hypothetical protein
LFVVSIVEFKRAKLLQDAKLSGITVKDIARALASMAGVKALSDYDAGLTGGYLKKAEALLELAIECAYIALVCSAAKLLSKNEARRIAAPKSVSPKAAKHAFEPRTRLHRRAGRCWP